MDWIEVHTDRPVVVAANDPSPRYPRVVPEQMRRTQLMAAAEDLFLDRGFVATTMSDIARAAGMSKKTLYKLFESKTELFRAMLLRGLPDRVREDARFAAARRVKPSGR